MVDVAARTRLHEFAAAGQLVEELAWTIAGRLVAAIAAHGGAVLAVSGGTTPGPLFDRLSQERLDWSKVVVTLVDERFVAPDSERSNERLIRERLLTGEAAQAQFLNLHSEAPSVEEAAASADAAISLLQQPFDVVVLGMGTDGHTASFFPDAPNIGELMDPGCAARVLPVRTASGGEPRLTLTLPVIAAARFVALHIEGQAKRTVLDQALAEEASPLPIRTVVDASAHPVSVYWAP